MLGGGMKLHDLIERRGLRALVVGVNPLGLRLAFFVGGGFLYIKESYPASLLLHFGWGVVK